MSEKRLTAKIKVLLSRSRIGSLGDVGLVFMMLCSEGSKAMASTGRESSARLIHRIWMAESGKNGVCKIKLDVIRTISVKALDITATVALRMLAKPVRPSWIAA